MRKLFGPAALLLVAALAVSGCGGVKTASVAGKVSYKGRPVTSGKVTVKSQDGKAGDIGVIQPDGTFVIAKAPVGPVKIAVDNPPPPGLVQGGMEVPRGMSPDDPEIKAARDQAKNFVAIPAKYGDPEQSGLTTTLTSGKNELPLDLQ